MYGPVSPWKTTLLFLPIPPSTLTSCPPKLLLLGLRQHTLTPRPPVSFQAPPPLLPAVLLLLLHQPPPPLRHLRPTFRPLHLLHHRPLPLHMSLLHHLPLPLHTSLLHHLPPPALHQLLALLPSQAPPLHSPQFMISTSILLQRNCQRLRAASGHLAVPTPAKLPIMVPALAPAAGSIQTITTSSPCKRTCLTNTLPRLVFTPATRT